MFRRLKTCPHCGALLSKRDRTCEVCKDGQDMRAVKRWVDVRPTVPVTQRPDVLLMATAAAVLLASVVLWFALVRPEMDKAFEEAAQIAKEHGDGFYYYYGTPSRKRADIVAVPRVYFGFAIAEVVVLFALGLWARRRPGLPSGLAIAAAHVFLVLGISFDPPEVAMGASVLLYLLTFLLTVFAAGMVYRHAP